MKELVRRLGAAACALAALAFWSSDAAAQNAPAYRATVPLRSAAPPSPAAVRPTPPPLPLPLQSAMRSTMVPGSGSKSTSSLAYSGYRRVYGLKRPAVPGFKTALAHSKRSTMSASGATIILTGDAYNNFLQNITLAYNTDVYPWCNNLAPSANYRFVVFPPDGSQWTSANFAVSATGQCPINDAQSNWNFYTGTPFVSGSGSGNTTTATPGTDPAYSGVWVLALQNMTAAGSPFDTMAYLVVIGGHTMTTYGDSGYSHPSNDYHPGDTVYVGATGLDPSHSYAYGFVNTSQSPLACVYTDPAVGTMSQPNCFVNGTTTGIAAPSGTFNGAWATSGATHPGTYNVELWDATTHDLLVTQQFSIQASTINWTLVPYNGATNGTNLGDTFATDALLDQSTVGVNFKATGLPSNNKMSFTLSDPGGFVFTPNYGSQIQAAPQSVTPVGGVATVGNVAFPYNVGLTLGTGPTFLAFAPHVYTAQLYDTVTNNVVASKSFSVLAYKSAFNWTAPQVVAANGNTVMPAATQTITVTNNGGPSFGTYNTDAIVGIKITTGAGGETVTLAGAGATDTAGNSWTFTQAGGVITGTLAGGQAMPDGASVQIPVTLLVPAGKCPSGCIEKTQILPQHGVMYSAADTATNGLTVIAQGASSNNVVSTESLAVTSGPAPLGTPRYPQMMYIEGTGGVASSATYNFQITIKNNDPANNIMDFTVAMPTSYDSNTPPTPSGNGVTINGAASAGWSFLNQQQMAGTVNQQNVFAWTCNGTTKNGCGIPPGGTGVFNVKLPVLNQSSNYQQIPVVANFDGGCKVGTGNAACGLTALTLSPKAGTTNSPAGSTNLDSTELGFYSLDPAKMTSGFQPATIGAGAVATTTFKLTNTSTVQDPFPDWIDQITATMPSNMDPGSASIGLPTGWTQVSRTLSGGNVIYVWGLCAAPPCASEVNAVPPGGSISFAFNYTVSPPTGTHVLEWQVTGANGGATVPSAASPTYSATLTTISLAASAQFLNADGYPSGNPVANGTEASVGVSNDPTYGNAYVYRVLNTGGPAINKVVVTIPWKNSHGVSGADSGNPSVDWTLTPKAAPVITVTGNGSGASPSCSASGAVIVQPNPGSGTDGSITLTGCNMLDGQNIDIGFTAFNPYQIGSEFVFPTAITNTILGTTVNAAPAWPTAEYVAVTLEAKLTVNIPSVGLPLKLPNPTTGGSTPNTVCPGACTYVPGAIPQINLGSAVAGVTTATDLVNVSVQSNAGSSTNGWGLYVSVDNNPNNTQSGLPEITTFVDPTTTKAPVGASYSIVAGGPGYVAIPTIASPSNSNPGLSLATFNGTTAIRPPIDSIMNYQLTTTGDPSGSHTALITYWLIPY